MPPKNLALAMSLLLVVAVHATGCSPTDSASEDSMASTDSALSAAQCMYFAANGTTRICHKTSSLIRPYVVLNVSEQACTQAHAGHLGDYVAHNDPDCLGLGCLPEGAPYDNTVRCCSGLTPINGTCGRADLCAGSTCGNDSKCKLGCDSATGQCVVAPEGQACGTNATCDAQAACTAHYSQAVSIYPGTGTHTAPLSVTLSSATAGATLYYTTDGTNPTTSSTVYSAPFTLTASATVRAFAVKEGHYDSPVTSTAYTLVNNMLRVSPAGDDTTGNGSEAYPFATPTSAATAAVGLSGTTEIHVAAGTYTLSGTVYVPANTALLGGYDGVNWGAQDTTANITTFDASAVQYGVDVNANALRVDGIHIVATPASNTRLDVCFFSHGGATISRNSCTCTLTTSNRRIGIYLDGAPASALIENNTLSITGPASAQSATGIYLTSANATVRFNTITTEFAGTQNYGMYVSPGFVTNYQLYGNIVAAVSPAAVGRVFSLAVNFQPSGSQLLVANNTFVSGEAVASGTEYVFSMQPQPPSNSIKIENNLIFSRYPEVSSNRCVLAARVNSLKNNNLFDCPAGLYSDGSSLQTTIAQVNAVNGAADNVSFDMVNGTHNFFVNEASDFHLKSGDTGGFSVVKRGGLDLSPLFTLDRDGNLRTGAEGTGWSMGAYEQDL